jgi:hypothetical protein
VTALNGIILSLNSIPGLNIHPSLLESDVTECEPEEKTTDREEVLGGNQEGVHDEEVHQELDTQQELSITEGTEEAVAILYIKYWCYLPSPKAPIPYALLTLFAKPVIFLETKLADHEYTDSDSRGVRKSDIHQYVVPPALTEMREDMLPGKLHEFV